MTSSDAWGAGSGLPVQWKRRIRRPIIVIGAGRSGTSTLARLLSFHPDVAYLGEPRPIWMYGNAYRDHHRLTAEDLTPEVANYIDRRFAEFLAGSGKSRFAEKTPSNCLRIPFIHALYPDCRIVNIVRDGRGVVRSMLRVRERKPSKGLIRRRMLMTPLREWPSYLPMFLRTVFRTNVLRKPARHWGAQPPGWRHWLDLPPHLAAAHQWRALVEISLRDGRQLPAENYLELRYEWLLAEPSSVMGEVLDFAGLAGCQEVRERAARRMDPARSQRWHSTISSEQEHEVEEVLRPLLEELEETIPARGPSVGS